MYRDRRLKQGEERKLSIKGLRPTPCFRLPQRFSLAVLTLERHERSFFAFAATSFFAGLWSTNLALT